MGFLQVIFFEAGNLPPGADAPQGRPVCRCGRDLVIAAPVRRSRGALRHNLCAASS